MAGEGFEVATASLRTEAGVWEQQSQQVGTIAASADGLRFTRLEAGVFQIIVTAYASVVDQVTNRAREGQQRMQEIADTLRRVADVYEDEERRGIHRLLNLR